MHTTELHGSTISFLNTASGLIKFGVEIYLVIPRHNTLFESIAKKYDVSNFIISKVALSFYPKRKKGIQDFLLYYFRLPMVYVKLCYRKYRFYRELKIIVAETRPDIIHTNTGVIAEGYIVAKLFSIPHVWHIREYQEKDFFWNIFPSKKLFIRCLKDSNVITITNDLRNYFHQDLNNNALTIYNGILHCKEREFLWPKENYFLCASRISPEKGIDDVIKAFGLFYTGHKNYHLCLLGSGNDNYINHLKTLALEKCCLEAVEFLGFKNDVKPYMRRARALVVASYYEGFGRMTAEACFCGCIVIGRDTGGTKEILEKTGGFLFNDIEGLFSMMNRVVDLNVGNYKGMANNASNIASLNYSIEANVEGVYKLYKKICKDDN